MSPLTPLIFIAFVPLLMVADKVQSRKSFFGHIYLAMLLWNLLTTWWIINASMAGAVMAFIANSFLMSLPWLAYHLFKKRFGKRIAYFTFTSCWMAFEYIHLNWQLSWPWLNLGNVFATQTDWVQWYEYTGIGGGTLWVLLINLLVFDWLFGDANKQVNTRYWFHRYKAIGVVVLLLIPILVSVVMGTSIDNTARTTDPGVIIVQPNIDPYGKFEASSVPQQIQKHLELSENAVDSNTRLVIWPETALSAAVAINEVQQQAVYQPVFDFLSRHPQITLLTGIETYRLYGTEKPASPYARKSSFGQYFDSYNAAVSLKAGQPLQYYIKSNLDPG